MNNELINLTPEERERMKKMIEDAEKCPEVMQKLIETASSKLEGTPCFVVVGTSQVGKSTFLNKMLGKPVMKVGKNNQSCTTTCYFQSSSNYAVWDTPGLFDSQGEQADQRNKDAINTIVNAEQDKRPNCLLLFHKFTDPFTGVPFASTQFAVELSKKLNCQIGVVVTFSNVAENSFPDNWIDKICSETNKQNILLTELYDKWKTELENQFKALLDKQGYYKQPAFFYCDFGRTCKNKGYTLPDGKSFLPTLVPFLNTCFEEYSFKMVCEVAKSSPDTIVKQEANDAVITALKKAVGIIVPAALTIGTFAAFVVIAFIKAKLKN